MNTEPGRYRIRKTHVTDPARKALLIRVTFESLSKRKLHLDVLYDPSLGNDHQDETSRSRILATPLAWSHAQYVRLAWSVAADHPVEQPSIVAARYGN